MGASARAAFCHIRLIHAQRIQEISWFMNDDSLKQQCGTVIVRMNNSERLRGCYVYFYPEKSRWDLILVALGVAEEGIQQGSGEIQRKSPSRERRLYRW